MSVEGPERFTGGCLCGSVRIVASGRPYQVRGLGSNVCATFVRSELEHAEGLPGVGARRNGCLEIWDLL